MIEVLILVDRPAPRRRTEPGHSLGPVLLHAINLTSMGLLVSAEIMITGPC